MAVYVINAAPSCNRSYWDARGCSEGFAEDLLTAQEDLLSRATTRQCITRLQAFYWTSLLEVGCGFGRNIQPLKEAFPGRILIGMDFSIEQLRRAPKFVSRPAAWCVAELEWLPVLDHSVDIVMTHGVLMYIHPEKLCWALHELRRVLSRGLLLAEYDVQDNTLPWQLHRRATAGWFAHDYRQALNTAGWILKAATPCWTAQQYPERMSVTLFEALPCR